MLLRTPLFAQREGGESKWLGLADLMRELQVNAGAFALYIGGAAINNAFRNVLEKANHDTYYYEFFHR